MMTDPRILRLEQDNARLKAELERVDKERIEYLQNVSHQLVAPLNAIKWHIENLTQGRLGIERGKKVLRSIYSQATLAVHLAKNFALMSNLESDHVLSALREPLQPVNLCQLAINLADDFQPLAWDKDVQICVQNEPLNRAPDVIVIKPLVSQVFSNVIENAVKYSKKGSEISIFGRYNQELDSVAVTVKNHGIPLGDGDDKKVFERGYRTDAAKNLYPAGTGFGLYIAHKIVQVHEGAITASMDARGFVAFSIALPVKALAGKTREREPKNRPAGR
jgi:signal transduction histidine kinase